ncbi:MAG: hypothetical protein ACK4S7_12720 [Sphingorhabdus sp.]
MRSMWRYTEMNERQPNDHLCDGNKTVDQHEPDTVVSNDAESSTETIIERSEAGAASRDGEGNDVQDHALHRPAPFARSSFSVTFIIATAEPRVLP